MARSEIRCAYCGKSAMKETGEINRAIRAGLAVYCDRECAGLGRRSGKTTAQLKAEKASYDREFRAKNRARLKAEKADYFKRTYDPVKAADARKARMPAHVAYCRRPEYIEWKRQYDRGYRSREFGEFSESYLILVDLQKEILTRATRYEISLTNGTFGKSQKRKREYGKSFGC